MGLTFLHVKGTRSLSLQQVTFKRTCFLLLQFCKNLKSDDICPKKFKKQKQTNQNPKKPNKKTGLVNPMCFAFNSQIKVILSRWLQLQPSFHYCTFTWSLGHFKGLIILCDQNIYHHYPFKSQLNQEQNLNNVCIYIPSCV